MLQLFGSRNQNYCYDCDTIIRICRAVVSQPSQCGIIKIKVLFPLQFWNYYDHRDLLHLRFEMNMCKKKTKKKVRIHWIAPTQFEVIRFQVSWNRYKSHEIIDIWITCHLICKCNWISSRIRMNTNEIDQNWLE